MTLYLSLQLIHRFPTDPPSSPQATQESVYTYRLVPAPPHPHRSALTPSLSRCCHAACVSVPAVRAERSAQRHAEADRERISAPLRDFTRSTSGQTGRIRWACRGLAFPAARHHVICASKLIRCIYLVKFSGYRSGWTRTWSDPADQGSCLITFLRSPNVAALLFACGSTVDHVCCGISVPRSAVKPTCHHCLIPDIDSFSLFSGACYLSFHICWRTAFVCLWSVVPEVFMVCL